MDFLYHDVPPVAAAQPLMAPKISRSPMARRDEIFLAPLASQNAIFFTIDLDRFG